MTTKEILIRAKEAKFASAGLTTEKKNEALKRAASSLLLHRKKILEANALDVEDAKGKLSESMIDRLALNEKRIEGMAQGLRDLTALDDPCGKVLERIERPNGLVIEKTAVPFGVLAIIYEARPNVTSDAAGLALKSGNVCLLRCGKEAHRSCAAIVDVIREGLTEVGLCPDLLQLVEDTSRASASELMEAVGYVDLLIPRGGKGLIDACVKNAKVPCIQTGTGICHVFVDESADFEKALNIIENAKTSRPSVCNAEEVLLVHEAIAEKFLPLLKKRLTEREKPVELRCDPRAFAIIGGKQASENDFDTEFLDLILAVGVVKDVREAIAHIGRHSTGHSEAIVTENEENASLFTSMIDAAAVYVNASTRFTDGGEFGLGCEIGISTQKLHARGPMGPEEVCTYKYIVRGNGQTR